jgi:hypothetical protein
VDVPEIGRVGDNCLKAGEEFTVSAAVAGELPGRWRDPTAAEAAENYAGLLTRTVDGDVIEVQHPGHGLLAQVGNYRLVDVAPAAKTAARAARPQEV